MKTLTLFLVCLISFVYPHFALSRHPEMMYQESSSQWIEREGFILLLNGRFIHTVSLFGIQVYEISLFLEKQSKSPEEILRSPSRKVIILKLLRNLDAEQLRSALSKGFEENCVPLCNRLKGYLNQINSRIPDFKEGDILEFQFFPTNLIVQSSRGQYSSVDSADFSRTLLSIWLGSNPPSNSLKNGILGLSQNNGS